MITGTHRSESQGGAIDKFLGHIADRLVRALSDTQRRFRCASLRLRRRVIVLLADHLVDFAEDVHTGIGIWAAYEKYNQEFFGTPLPLTERLEGGDPPNGIHLDRVRHLLWMLYPQFIPGLVLSPVHQDMECIAEMVHELLAAAFRPLPRESGTKAILQSPNTWGWDVKKKLVWLGTQSYMFRALHATYLRKQNRGKSDIGCTDDFLCQECTRWSGLGAIDILSRALNISEDDRRDVRSWYERHASFYRIFSVNDDTLEAVNVICDRRYRIRMNMPGHPFRSGQMVFGSLVPWRGEWYWSGLQQKWDNAAAMNVDELRNMMKRQNAKILCRFWPEYEAQVRESATNLHKHTMAFYGKDLTVYPDGLNMAADWQKEMEANWKSRPPEVLQDAMQRHGLKDGRPQMQIPKDMVGHKDGIGVFINTDEGKEIMCGFDAILSGFERKGESLTEDEMDAIRGFIQADAVSPQFVRRVVAEYGDQSIRVAYLLREDAPPYALDYILRSYKGDYYRRRYPCVAVI